MWVIDLKNDPSLESIRAIDLRQRHKTQRKWFLQVFLTVLFSVIMIYLLYLTGANLTMVVASAAFVIFFLLFFNFIALRNYYVGPYARAAARLRAMSRGMLQDKVAQSTFPEATDLMTAINELSAELQTKQKMIEKLERMRIEFVANVSHELKTPLTSIKGYTETLKSGASKDAVVSEKFLTRIEDNANRLIAIIGDLLELSHLESFPNDIQWEIFDSKLLMQKLDSIFLPVIEQKRQGLQLKFSDDKLEGDLKRLEQVFINLVGNANRYCPEGAVIEVIQSKSALHWILEVVDNGPGIPKEHQARIFERFYRVDSDRSRETGGTGLGLAIAKHIVLLHDGTITLQSDTNQGTHFIIQWPRRLL